MEVDSLLWQSGWRLAPVETYNAAHALLIAQEQWIIDGLGRQESIPHRLSRATDIVVIDMPLWMHFWLAAERQLNGPPARWTTRRPASRRCRPPRRCSGRSGRLTGPGCRRSAGSLPWRRRAA